LRRFVTFGLTLLVVAGCSLPGWHDVQKPQRLTSTLCDAIGLDKLYELVPDGKVEQYGGADDDLIDDLADAGCNVRVANDRGWGDVRIVVRRSGQTRTSTALEHAEQLVERECEMITAPDWKDDYVKHNKGFVAGPPTEPIGVGDEACMITGEYTLLESRVAEVWVYARRGIEFVQLNYGWGNGDITAMSTKAVDLTKAIFNAKLR
jgi:hypothetical protein